VLVFRHLPYSRRDPAAEANHLKRRWVKPGGRSEN
jgi:hypothetical protein